MLSFKSWINQVQYFRLDLRVVEIQLNQDHYIYKYISSINIISYSTPILPLPIDWLTNLTNHTQKKQRERKKEMAGGAFAPTSSGKEYPGKFTGRVLLTCIFAATGDLIFGYDLGISGM